MHQKNNTPELSILIPVFNEIQYLDIFIKNLRKSFNDQNIEYIFIDDGSTDGSLEWLKDYVKNLNKKNLKLIEIKKNSGKGNALHHGLKECNGEYILFQDSDLELDPKDSLEMFKIIKEKKYIDCIFGNRYLSGKLKRNNNFLNEFIGKINSLIFNILFMTSVSDVHCGTKIISKKIKKIISLNIKDFGFEIDLASQIAKNNFKIFEYGISYFSRTISEGKKITWIDGLKTYYYLFKTRFIYNEISTQISIIFSSFYMIYVGSYFGNGQGKILAIFAAFIIGLLIGVHRKIFSSLLIFLFIYLGSIFGSGNSQILTILVCFILGIYISKNIKKYFNNKFNSKLINFFI